MSRIRNIHTFGTSHTEGGGFEFDTHHTLDKVYSGISYPMTQFNFSWPGQLNHLLTNNIEVHNHAKSGYGNERVYRKVIDVVTSPNFDIKSDVLLLELSELGRKEYYHNDIGDYVINNYMFNNDTHFSFANTYYKDKYKKEITDILGRDNQLFFDFYKKTINVDIQIKTLQQNLIFLINFLNNNNIIWYLVAGAPIFSPAQSVYVDYESKLIDYYFPKFDSTGGYTLKHYHDFIDASHENGLCIVHETNEYFSDEHQGLFANKIISKTIYNRLCDDGLISNTPLDIDYSEWNDIRDKTRNNLLV